MVIDARIYQTNQDGKKKYEYLQDVILKAIEKVLYDFRQSAVFTVITYARILKEKKNKKHGNKLQKISKAFLFSYYEGSCKDTS